MAATMDHCPVVGSTQTLLPPSHPEFDLNKDGLVCPVTKATTDHHHNMAKHPAVPGSAKEMSNAENCPALQKVVSNPEEQKMDDAICPIVGTATSVLPPDHPSLAGKNDDAVCPKVGAKLGDHKDKMIKHPQVSGASKDAVCPVAGVKAS